ncbi:MAG: DUF2993 domain-containing protein [Lawsonella sp.]
MRTWIRRTAIAVAAVVALGAAEIGISSYAEDIMAQAVAQTLKKDTTPSVSITSFPNLLKLPFGRTGGFLVNLDDYPYATPDIPLSNIQVEYSNLRFNQSVLFSGQAPDFSFGEGTGRVYISGSALALHSGIADFQFQASNDASPAGIGEDKALISGTIDVPCASEGSDIHFQMRAHVFYWKEGKRVEIDPEDIISYQDNTPNRPASMKCTVLSEEMLNQAKETFSLSLRVPALPLGIDARLAFAQSGNLVIVGPTPLSPISGKKRARFPDGTSSKARWENLQNYMEFAPR